MGGVGHGRGRGRFASIGPRQRRRGDLENRIFSASNPTCFNRATPTKARRPRTAPLRRRVSPGFNRATPTKARRRGEGFPHRPALRLASIGPRQRRRGDYPCLCQTSVTLCRFNRATPTKARRRRIARTRPDGSSTRFNRATPTKARRREADQAEDHQGDASIGPRQRRRGDDASC